MANIDESFSEKAVKKAIAQQIKKFGMDHLTGRKIRENLQNEFKIDFNPYKATIDKITMDIINDSSTDEKEEEKKESNADGSPSESDEEVFTDLDLRKKGKTRKRPKEDSDSYEEPSTRRRRQVTRKNPAKAKAPGERKTTKKLKGGYGALCAFSEDLTAIMGCPYGRRCDVVKKMWDYFRQHALFDPKNKRYVICDEPLYKLAKTRRFLAFSMMKIISDHIYEAKTLNDEERAKLEAFEEERERLAKMNETADAEKNDEGSSVSKNEEEGDSADDDN